MTLPRGSMYSENSVGPNTEPWGTPQVTLLVCDFALPRATCSVLSVRYEVNQFFTFPDSPMVYCRR